MVGKSGVSLIFARAPKKMLDKRFLMWYTCIIKKGDNIMMTRTQFILNIIFFLPLLVVNFFAYGVDGCIRFVKEMKGDDYICYD